MNRVEQILLNQGGEPKKITREQYYKMQAKIIASPELKKVVAEKKGHQPTPGEIENFYIDSGLADKFHDKYKYLVEERI